ncbi:sensor histidine kinase [Fodinicola acaciae]|uniref:sensor histidine kinase n=1 Tax=Fodinicola acaciae TaxID=2681555 RepID=UPI0013D145FD|nr:sensor histidine kinase [Fodinicola acaciae]
MTWRPSARTIDIAIVVAVAAVVTAGTFRPGAGPPRLNLVGWGLIGVACLALLFRRRYPVTVCVLTMVTCGIYYPITEPDGPIVLTFVVALHAVAAAGRLAAAIGLGVTSVLLLAYGELTLVLAGRPRQLDDLTFLLLTGWLVAAVALGAVVSQASRNRERELRERATDERLRIARELHDVLGHHISLINVQASAALHRLPDDPADSLRAIKDSSKVALRELRATLGVLRQVDESAPTAPAPGLARLEDLVRAAQTAGVAVRTDISGPATALPSEIDLAAYRIVQEALTNVTRHAAATTATVGIAYAADHVCVRVEDDGRGGGSAAEGNGLRGMRERVAALGGELTTGDRAGGGFQVCARLPR